MTFWICSFNRMSFQPAWHLLVLAPPEEVDLFSFCVKLSGCTSTPIELNWIHTIYGCYDCTMDVMLKRVIWWISFNSKFVSPLNQTQQIMWKYSSSQWPNNIKTEGLRLSFSTEAENAGMTFFSTGLEESDSSI